MKTEAKIQQLNMLSRTAQRFAEKHQLLTQIRKQFQKPILHTYSYLIRKWKIEKQIEKQIDFETKTI